MTECRADAEDAAFRVALVSGSGYDSSHPSSEANLNMQYSPAIAYPTPHTIYSTGGEVYIHNNKLDSDDPDERPILVDDHPIRRLRESSPTGVYNVLVRTVQRTRLRGISVIFISSNDSVGGGNSLAEDGSGRVGFIPEFRGSCRNLLGFLNLWLYDIGIYGLNDITSGSNPGCGTDGFTAITGWGPVLLLTWS
ncbi:hypothetical protein EDB92DRAFT_1953889 [Lactarius akahatsu]|uniref:Uncharacterized protein n=1 Tax=Lactarius akahatsu TaxID=416441 RepID=A0AAD4L518_9AGAM|nr:hypothetical protein EDB92DRAFT_1953889 [Lactarius akahatsu]